MTSRTSRAASRPPSDSAVATSSTKPGCSSWAPATLTLRYGAPAQVAAWRTASRRTQRPSGHDQAGLLGQRDELAGAEEAARRVLPAHQRLEAGDAAEVEVDDRLVVQDQLVVLDRALELLAAVEPGDGVDVHVVGEDREAVGAGGLGGVHREVGVAQQVVAGVGGGDADAGAQVQALALEHHGGGEDVEQAVDQRVDVGDVRGRGSRTRRRRGGRRCRRRAARGAGARRDLQQAVAGGVAERVVDALEVVEVEEGDDGGLAAASGSRRSAARTASGWAGRSASPRRRAGAGRRRAGGGDRRRSSRASRAVRPTTSRTMTAIVPIQDIRSLRAASSRLRSAARAQRGRGAARRRSIVAVVERLQRARSRAPAGARTPPRSIGWKASNGAQTPARRRHAVARWSSSSCARMPASVAVTSAWTGERHAAGGRSPPTRARRCGWRSPGRRSASRSARGARRRDGAEQRCRAVATVATTATTAAIRIVRLPCIPPGGRPEAPPLDRFSARAFSW